MAFEYTIWARSPSLNQEIRQFNLEKLRNIPFTDQVLANQWGNSFAEQLNNRGHMGVKDWQALVKYEDVGMQTFVDYQNSIRP